MMQVGEKYREPYRGDIIVITGGEGKERYYHQLESTPDYSFNLGWSTDGEKPKGWVKVEDVSPYPFCKPIWQEVV